MKPDVKVVMAPDNNPPVSGEEPVADPGPPATAGAAPPAGITIGEASELLGVPAPTLRSWERRYGMPSTSRSTGGHRRYMPAEILLLRYMRDDVASGRPAGEAARRTRTRLDVANPSFASITALLEATRTTDADAIGTELDKARDDLGMAAALDDVVMPAMRQVGTMWETGRCDIGQTQFTSEVVRAWLARHLSLAPAPDADRRIVLSVGPRDLHTLGIEALAVLLGDQHVSCRVLGPRPSIAVLLEETSSVRPAAVVVVSHLTTQRRSAVDSLQAVAQLGYPTCYAGNAFILPAARRDVPGTYLGESITGAAELIRRHLPS